MSQGEPTQGKKEVNQHRTAREEIDIHFLLAFLRLPPCKNASREATESILSMQASRTRTHTNNTRTTHTHTHTRTPTHTIRTIRTHAHTQHSALRSPIHWSCCPESQLAGAGTRLRGSRPSSSAPQPSTSWRWSTSGTRMRPRRSTPHFH